MAEVSGSAQDSGVETEGDQVTFEKLSVLVEGYIKVDLINGELNTDFNQIQWGSNIQLQ